MSSQLCNPLHTFRLGIDVPDVLEAGLRCMTALETKEIR